MFILPILSKFQYFRDIFHLEPGLKVTLDIKERIAFKYYLYW